MYHFATRYTWAENALLFSVVVHISAWIMQFVGHGVYEKRKPALLDNLVQALVLAPFFVFCETLFMFGYRPALAKSIDEKAALDIAKWKESQSKKAK